MANYSDIYRLSSSPKGLALVINNKTFDEFEGNCEEREGTDEDKVNIVELLKKLDYSVQVEENLTYEKIRITLRTFAIDERHNTCDSAIVVILSHGTERGIVGTNWKLISFGTILNYFKPNFCPALAEKPKIFIINACRGALKDNRFELGGNDANDAQEFKNIAGGILPSCRSRTDEVASNAAVNIISLEADFFIANSTPLGYVSWRCPITGSRFIRQICDVFSKNVKWKEICPLFTMVNNAITNELEGGIQIAEYCSRLRKQFYFYPEQRRLLFAVKKPVSHFTGRREKIEEIHEILSKNYNNDQRDFGNLIISGLGGIGKTQLVLSYIDKYKLEFDSTIWINAESRTALETSFSALASFLDIKSESFTFEEVAKMVARKVASLGRKNLFIFDNADDIDPIEVLPANFEQQICLITSRHREWDESKIINLESLMEEEAIQLVETLLEKKDEKKEDICEFVSFLQCFPLALRQATSYVKMKNKINTQRYTFKDYLVEFEANIESTKKLLSFLPKAPLKNKKKDDYFYNTLTTWKITFKRIKTLTFDESDQDDEGTVPNESLPSRMLNVLAYFSSDNIPVNVFLKIENLDEPELSWAVEILETFSLVEVNQGSMKIHKLIQQVTRLNLVEENRSEEFVSLAIDLLVKTFPLNDNRLEAVSLKQTLLPHLTELKVRIAHLEQESQLRKENFLDCYCLLLECIIDVCATMRETKQRKIACEELLSIQEEHYGSENIVIAKTLGYLANTYDDLADQKTMKNLLERALQIEERYYNSDHPEYFQVGITLTCLANAYGNLGQPEAMKTLLEKALKIKESHYGPDHYQVAITLSSLANAYGNLGDAKTMKTLFERMLEINKSYYGADHYQTAKSYSNLSRAYNDMGDYRTSKELTEKALGIQERYYGPDHFQVAMTLRNLAAAYDGLGDQQSVKTVLEKVLQLQQMHYAPDNYQLALTRYFLAKMNMKTNQFLAAKTLIEDALPVVEKHYGGHHAYANLLRVKLDEICKKLTNLKS